MPSSRFRVLTQRIRQLETRLLPTRLSPTGSYTARQLDLVRGYRLLVHAEFEAYLEDQVSALAVRALKRFQQDGKPRWVVASLIAYHFPKSEISDTKLRNLYAGRADHVQARAHEATTMLNEVVAKNNGLREINLLRLLLPIGIRTADIDQLWLGTMDSFGANRGQTAHTSFRVSQQLDPAAERQTVSDLLKGLERLDSLFKSLG